MVYILCVACGLGDYDDPFLFYILIDAVGNPGINSCSNP